MPEKKTLYLIPSVISKDNENAIPEEVRAVLKSLKWFLAENVRTVRRYISSLELGIDISSLQFLEYNKRTTDEELASFFEQSGVQNIGVISEAGCPGIADPGASAVSLAHAMGISVKPLTGPSSIMLALMGSGMSGQRFSFHGYLPIDKVERKQRIRELCNEVVKTGYTQIFMDTPYRNNQMLKAILKHGNEEVYLVIAIELGGPEEVIIRKKISDIGKLNIDIHKKNALFLLGN